MTLLNIFQEKNNKNCYYAGSREVRKDNFQWPWEAIFDPKTRDKKHFKNDKDNISSEESEKRIHRCCIMTGVFMHLLILSLVLSLYILSMELDIMIIEPKIGRDKYCKNNI